MHVAKPAASLSAGLLARRGTAKPAMRRAAVALSPLEDLGWNDLGAPVEPAVAAAVTPSPVARQIATLNESFTALRPAPAPAAARKAAFTLRLDAERHLRLRLLSAVTNQSAQALLVAALDALIAGHPDIDALADDPKVRDSAQPASWNEGQHPCA